VELFHFELGGIRRKEEGGKRKTMVISRSLISSRLKRTSKTTQNLPKINYFELVISAFSFLKCQVEIKWLPNLWILSTSYLCYL
jgi:hypothetical protein